MVNARCFHVEIGSRPFVLPEAGAFVEQFPVFCPRLVSQYLASISSKSCISSS